MAKKVWSLTDRAQLHKDANQELDANLAPGEPVLVVIPGEHKQAIIGTDRRLFIFKKGMAGGTMFGKKLISWDYRQVNGVMVETGMLTGSITIQVPSGSVADSSRWSRGDHSVREAANSMPISRDRYEQAQAGAALIRQLIADAHNPPRHASAGTAVGSFCTQCGESNSEQSRFCRACGMEL